MLLIFILKAVLFFKLFTGSHIYVVKQLGQKVKINFKIFDISTGKQIITM